MFLLAPSDLIAGDLIHDYDSKDTVGSIGLVLGTRSGVRSLLGVVRIFWFSSKECGYVFEHAYSQFSHCRYVRLSPGDDGEK